MRTRSKSQIKHKFIPKDNNTRKGHKKMKGRWTTAEKNLFKIAINLFGKDFKKIGEYIKTRTLSQIRSHTQKYLLKNSMSLSQKEITTKKQIPNDNIFRLNNLEILPDNIKNRVTNNNIFYNILYQLKLIVSNNLNKNKYLTDNNYNKSLILSTIKRQHKYVKQVQRHGNCI